MEDSTPQAVTHPGLSSLSPTLRHGAPGDAIVAQALACLPPFESWAHEPTPASIESALLDLSEQELMTTAAVCLVRLVRLQREATDAA